MTAPSWAPGLCVSCQKEKYEARPPLSTRERTVAAVLMFRGLFLVMALAQTLKHDPEPAWTAALVLALLGLAAWALFDFSFRRRDAVARNVLLLFVAIDVLEAGIAVAERRFPGLVQVIVTLATISAFQLLYRRRRTRTRPGAER